MFLSFLLWLPFSNLRSPFLLFLFVILAGAYTNESVKSKIRADEKVQKRTDRSAAHSRLDRARSERITRWRNLRGA